MAQTQPWEERFWPHEIIRDGSILTLSGGRYGLDFEDSDLWEEIADELDENPEIHHVFLTKGGCEKGRELHFNVETGEKKEVPYKTWKQLRDKLYGHACPRCGEHVPHSGQRAQNGETGVCSNCTNKIGLALQHMRNDEYGN